MTAATAPDTAADVAAIRAFNRFYTARVGALRDGLLATAHPLPEARVLYELGQVEDTDFADLRRTLDLDAGYLSRLLARLDEQGLVARERSAQDGRRQDVRLTARGRDAYATLDQRSAAEIAALLDGLAEHDRRRLLDALQTVRDVLEHAPPPQAFVLRDPQPGDYGWVVQRHGALYAQEYGWDQSFEALVAKVVADYANHHDPERERAWIAEASGRPVGCVFCMRRDERTAQLRCLLVEPPARGMGVGQALVDACVAFAREAGYERIVLWTNDVLVDARRLYERAGFVLTKSTPHRSFGRDGLVGEDWALQLDG
jgi:DNA-binding MarR family transcriptional regulator/N-acetylglutamate synthase-like GNAT family acetyltransferase